MLFNNPIKSSVIVSLFACAPSLAATIDETVVYSDFSQNTLLELSNSISVISEDVIKGRNATHLEDVLGLVPNLNFSSGASRGRFIQIRGIGERSQFVDPVNPSVGLIIDGMDFTGLGLSANTLDINQIEVLRGPQGSIFGANALAGLIALTSNAPSAEFTSRIAVTAAEYNSHTVDTVISGPLSKKVRYRLATRSNQSDGYIDNDLFKRDDTSNIDEQLVKAALAIDASDNIQFALNLIYLNVDNGYDSFSLNNNRRTTADQPGEDAQESLAGSVQIDWQTSTAFNYKIVLGSVDARTNYSYDEDWSYIGEFDALLAPYSSADSYQRDRKNTSLDIQAISHSKANYEAKTSEYVIGLYLRDDEETLKRIRFDSFAVEAGFPFHSEFDTRNIALYQQSTLPLSEHINLVVGARVEHRDADYRDNIIGTENTSETSVGGRLALEYLGDSGTLWYSLISQGYKSGGVNGQIISASVADSSNHFFDTETLTNFEIGMKGRWLDNRLTSSTAIFYQRRNDAQFKQSIFNASNFSFDDFLTNADGSSLGAEVELYYLLVHNIDMYASIGLLDAEFDDFESNAHVDARDDFTGPLAPINLNNRDVAHAPNYQFAIGGELRFSNYWFFGIDIEGKDAFFFSNSHNEKSDSYELYHARLGYRTSNLELSIWGRNLGDTDTEERGFYFSNEFGNNPGNGYAPETYIQFGEPRVIGVSASYNFN